jgi:hypothetical protein
MELYRNILQLPWPVSCLLVTGRLDEFTDTVPAEARRRLGLLRKPFRPEELVDRVRLLAQLANTRMSLGAKSNTQK